MHENFPIRGALAGRCAGQSTGRLARTVAGVSLIEFIDFAGFIGFIEFIEFVEFVEFVDVIVAERAIHALASPIEGARAD
jgi:hypothetical protein